jgi:deoxyribodipyrimidine photo-lyase
VPEFVSRAVPSTRLRAANDQPTHPAREYVLYWMRSSRRVDHNFALDRAVELALELGRPLLVFEALRCDYRWASDRHHAFVIAGMRDNQVACERYGVTYYPFVEDAKGRGRGLLRELASHACVVVTDDHPGFHFPAMLTAAAAQLDVRLETVDSIGLLPMALAPKDFPTAYAFRAFLQRELPEQLGAMPKATPLAKFGLPRARVPAAIAQRWPAADPALLGGSTALLAALPIDHTVGVCDRPGGPRAGIAAIRAFVGVGLDTYDERRNHPDDDGGSKLSAYLHFGHVSVHAVLRELAARCEWSPGDLGRPRRGAREGFWGLPAPIESFLDELVVWRELGHNFAHARDDIDRYSSLPGWARATLAQHAADPRPYLYDAACLEGAETHDEIWNAAQRQLVREGRMHNYLRMLWGKRVLEWTAQPEAAAQRLVELNNRWALDGRDPNSYSGIFWVFGRYDRPWAPKRPIFGSIRYMSSDATRRKLRLKKYLERYAAT